MSEQARDDDERLPFEVELERLPLWAHVSSALVIVVGGLVASRLVHMLVLLPFLVASSLGRRLSTIATHLEVHERGVDLGGRTIARSDIVDVWVDDEGGEPRVTVAFGDRVSLAVLHFPNLEQARRFSRALRPERADERSPVVGHLPRPIDWLPSIRFVAIAAAFFGTGSSLGLLVLALFALGAWNILSARQIIARDDRVEIRSALGATSHPYDEIERVDVADGVLHLKDGEEITVPRSALRDPLLGSGPWLERARARVFTRVARR